MKRNDTFSKSIHWNLTKFAKILVKYQTSTIENLKIKVEQRIFLTQSISHDVNNYFVSISKTVCNNLVKLFLKNEDYLF